MEFIGEQVDLVAGQRQTGRTTELVKWALSEDTGKPRYIVCHSRREAHRLFREDFDRAELEGRSPIRMPLTLHEFRNYQGFPALFAIDNLDLMLSNILGPNVVIATIETPRIIGGESE